MKFEKESEKIDAELKQTLLLYQSALASSINAISFADLEGNLTYVNHSFLKLWGYDSDKEVLRKPATYFWQSKEKALEIIEALRSQGAWFGELVAKRKNGFSFNAQLSASMVKDESGKPICMMASFVDITEHKKMDEELRNSEERLKIFFEDAPDAYYLSDLKGTFIDGNKAAEETTGYKKEELIGKSFLRLKLLPPSQLPKAAAALAKNALGNPTGPDEFTLNRKDGRQVEVEISTHPVKIKGKILILGIARNTTERRHAKEEINKRIEEIEKINKFMVGRELDMVELKKEANLLLKELGRPEKYKISE